MLQLVHGVWHVAFAVLGGSLEVCTTSTISKVILFAFLGLVSRSVGPRTKPCECPSARKFVVKYSIHSIV